MFQCLNTDSEWNKSGFFDTEQKKKLRGHKQLDFSPAIFRDTLRNCKCDLIRHHALNSFCVRNREPSAAVLQFFSLRPNKHFVLIRMSVRFNCKRDLISAEDITAGFLSQDLEVCCSVQQILFLLLISAKSLHDTPSKSSESSSAVIFGEQSEMSISTVRGSEITSRATGISSTLYHPSIKHATWTFLMLFWP